MKGDDIISLSNSVAPLIALAVFSSLLGLLREHTVTVEVPAATTCACGYSLTGLPDRGLCPECGETFDQRTPAETIRGTAWISRQGLPVVAIALVLWIGVLASSAQLARLIFAVGYRVDGFSWETSFRAPLVRELWQLHGWEALPLWAGAAALAPIFGRIPDRREAIKLVLALHGVLMLGMVFIPIAVGLIRLALS